MNQRNKFLVYIYVAVIFFISVIIYYRATAVYFLADDFFYIFNRNNWEFYSPFTHFFYQPITLFVYFLNYFWAGLSPYNYHLFTIVLNAINNVILFFVFYKLLNNKLYAFIIMLLSAVYYFSADNMIWINCTNNVICGFFYALTLYCFVDYKQTAKINKLYFSILFFNLTLFTREMGVSVILIIYLIDIFFFEALSDKKKFLKLAAIFFFFFLCYLIVMAIGPTMRYGRLTFNRGAYSLIFDIKEIIININWFIFRTFIPFSFGSHIKIGLLNIALNFIRFNYIPVIVAGLLMFIIRNKNYYFGLFWIILTAGPYLLLNIYFVHTGDRYFYLPHIGMGFILLGIWQYLREKISNFKIIITLKIYIYIFFVMYIIVSVYALQKRIDWWIKAGDSSKQFLTAFQNSFLDISENTAVFIKDVPRWADDAPNKLIVLITGASYALKLFYNRNNIEVIPYWDDYSQKNIDALETISQLKKFDNYIFLEYKQNSFYEWQPPELYKNAIKNYF